MTQSPHSPSGMKHFIRGGQTVLHSLRLFNQIAHRLVGLGVSVAAVSWLAWVLWYVPWPGLVRYAQVLLNQGMAVWFNVGSKHPTHVPLSRALSSPHFVFIQRLVWQGLFASGLISLGTITLTIVFLSLRGRYHTQTRHKGGDRLAPSKHVRRLLKRQGCASSIVLGTARLPLAKDSEVQHLLLDGTTGTGKSTAIRELLDIIRARGERALIWDEGGHTLKYYFKPEQDILLNPLDARGQSWDLWQECQTQADFENLSTALIPMRGQQDPFWILAARTLCSEMAAVMAEDKAPTAPQLLTRLTTSSKRTLKKYLKNTLAAGLVADDIDKLLLSIQAECATYLKCLRYCVPGSHPFSIRKWVRDETQSNWLFISSLENQHEALKPLITAWFDLAMRELLSLPENSNKRLWIILDELGSLHPIPTLQSLLAKARKVGGCVVIGTQNSAQLTHLYGRHGAQAISSLLNTRLLFRQTDPELAQWSARNLGEHIQNEVREGLSYGANTLRDGVSLNRIEVCKPLISHSDILQLPDLQCYVRLPGDYPITKLQFKPKQRKGVQAAWCLKQE